MEDSASTNAEGPKHPPLYRWLLQGEAEPQLLSRVLGCLSLRNALPKYFCSSRDSMDRVQIEVLACSECDATAHRLALRFYGIPSVIEVQLWASDGRQLEL
jgi:hypothetical protein